MMALVRGVTALATAAGSNVKVHGSTSTMTGVSRSRWMTSTVEMKVNEGVMTSSPGFRSSAMRAACSASVPFAQGTTWMGCASECPSQVASAEVKSRTAGPLMYCPERTTFSTASSISGWMRAYCPRTSTMWRGVESWAIGSGEDTVGPDSSGAGKPEPFLVKNFD